MRGAHVVMDAMTLRNRAALTHHLDDNETIPTTPASKIAFLAT